jgi:hypothetical protein
MIQDSIDKESLFGNFSMNGRKMPITSTTLSYEDIVEIFCKDRTLTPSVIYSRADEKNPTGILYRGKSVKIKDGTDISVAFTGNA